MERQIEYVPLLRQVQEYISTRYAAALTDKQNQLRSYVSKYLKDYGYTVSGMTDEEVTEKLFRDMAEYSVVTPFLDKDNIEEININAWEDMAVTYTNGKIVKIKEHFYSPIHAQDIIKRMLRQSNVKRWKGSEVRRKSKVANCTRSYGKATHSVGNALRYKVSQRQCLAT